MFDKFVNMMRISPAEIASKEKAKQRKERRNQRHISNNNNNDSQSDYNSDSYDEYTDYSNSDTDDDRQDEIDSPHIRGISQKLPSQDSLALITDSQMDDFEFIESENTSLIDTEVQRRLVLRRVSDDLLHLSPIRTIHAIFHGYLPPGLIVTFIIAISCLIFVYLFGLIRGLYALGIGIPTLASLILIESDNMDATITWLNQWVIFILLISLDTFLEPIFSFFAQSSYSKARTALYLFVVLLQPFSGNILVTHCITPIYTRNRDSISKTFNSASKQAMKATNEASFTLFSSIKSIAWSLIMSIGDTDVSTTTRRKREKNKRRRHQSRNKSTVQVEEIYSDDVSDKLQHHEGSPVGQLTSDRSIKSPGTQSNRRRSRQSRAWDEFDKQKDDN